VELFLFYRVLACIKHKKGGFFMKFTKKSIALLLGLTLAASVGVFALASDAPSLWATDRVGSAIEQELVPQELQSNYSQAMTRADFCSLAVTLYENVMGEISGRSVFVDCEDVDIQKAAYAGIVSGVGNNRFDPDSLLTREQAAVILANLARAIDRPLPELTPSFADSGDVASWAFDDVGRVQAAGIMDGVGGNRFAPQDPYTREQSIVTIMRTLDFFNEEGTPVVSQPGSGIQYIRTDWRYIEGAEYPIVTVITSGDELEQYCDTVKGIQDPSSRPPVYSDRTARFLEAVEIYTDEFFENCFLVLVLLQEESGSNRHDVKSIDEDGNIVIRRVAPEIGTADMAQWHIIIEFDNDFPVDKFSVTVLNEER